MTLFVEARHQRLALGLGERGRTLQERHTQIVWASRDRNPRLQVLVDAQMVITLGRLLYGERRDATLVEQQIQRVRAGLPQSANEAAPIAREPDLDLVLAVLGKHKRDNGPATGPDRKARNVCFLGDVTSHANRLALKRRLRAADRQSADSLRSGDVPVEKGRRQIANGDVVEAVAALVRRQERLGIDVERQQVPDGVLILGAVESPQGLGATRIRLGGRRIVERRFQPGQ